MPNTNISMCITACGRNDLLEQSLTSFYAVVDQEPQEVLIYEDSDGQKPEFLSGEIWRCRNVRWISGRTRMGQCFAVARLIQEAKHDYVFWSEEDWLWHNQISPFMRESKELLKFPNVVMVSLRGPSGWHPLVPDVCFGWMAEPYWRGVWGGWSWNPGLRRRDTLLKILPQVLASVGLKGLEHEAQLSKSLLDQGYRIADLGRPIVTHIGGNRSRSVEELPPLPRILIAVPTCFHLDYETHALENKEKFHVNGANDQTEAIRETWAKDFKPFRNVTLKFFYGCPADGYPRKPLDDEVFLGCGDGYDSLIQKSTALFTWAAEQGFEYTFKCDTDTLVYAERLLIEMMENSFDYAGYLHASVCSGGPGYFLSKHACNVVARHGATPRHPYAEDVHISRVLAESNIPPIMLPNHNSGFSAHFFFGDPQRFDASLLKENLVTAHAVFPGQLRQWYEYKNKFYGPQEQRQEATGSRGEESTEQPRPGLDFQQVRSFA